MKSVTNMNPAKEQIITLDEQQQSNELNDFYLRFDSQNFSQECDSVLQSLPATEATCCLEVDPPASSVSSAQCALARPQALTACQLFGSKAVQRNYQ